MLEIEGKTLWERQIELLRTLEPAELWVSGRAYGEARVIPDAWPDCGPLGGVASVLQCAGTKWVLVLAVDLPLMTAEFLRGLLEEALARGKGIVPWDGERFHPLAAVYPRAAADVARARLERGELALQGFVEESERDGLVQRRELAREEGGLLRNVNTPGDLEAIREACE